MSKFHNRNFDWTKATRTKFVEGIFDVHCYTCIHVGCKKNQDKYLIYNNKSIKWDTFKDLTVERNWRHVKDREKEYISQD